MSTQRERLARGAAARRTKARKARIAKEASANEESYLVRFNPEEDKSHTKNLATILVGLLVGVAAIAAIVFLVFG